MILDTLANAQQYYGLGPKFVKAFEYLAQTSLAALPKGKYEIDGTDVFVMINEYDTVPAEGEQMEAHRRYIDVQYMISGTELVGHDYLQQQTISKAYDENADYLLVANPPAFFSKLQQGQFAVFFPTDLHMPNIQAGGPLPVKKAVIKISVQ